MPSDLTIAEKAEKLGLARIPDTKKWWRDNRDGTVSVLNGRDVAALYAERFPTPDYRAALERLVDVAEQIENAGPGHEDWGALTNAIALARKVLHGQ